MIKKLIDLKMSDNKTIRILAINYGTHVSLTEVKTNDDINAIFGKTLLVSSKPSTIEEKLQYFMDECLKYSYIKVESYKIVDTQKSI